MKLNFFGDISEKSYCAFCSSARTVYTKRGIGWTDVLSCLVLSLIFMFLFWEQYDPRQIAIFVFLVGLTQFFVQLRWRLSLNCKSCGFDPLLYLKSHKEAAEKVKFFLEKRKTDPDYLLKPKLQLPVVKKSPSKNEISL